jgi:precorrin-6B methylase 2
MTFKSFIKKIYTRFGIDKTKFNDYIIAHNNSKLKQEILSYYLNKQLSEEEKIAINFLKKNSLSIYPYEFIKNYRPSDITVFKDLSTNLHYVNHNYKKLFFPKEMAESEIKRYYSESLKEQDFNSPHRYIVNGFQVNNDDIVLDVGCAEGLFSLDIIDFAMHVYIFESDDKWIDPLKATFDPWKEKVTIINKYVSDIDSDNTLTLDTYCKNFISKINFIKIDVEGNESRVISGAKKILESNGKIIVTICTYHKQSDFKDFMNIFQHIQYSIKPSDGFMIYYLDHTFEPPYFRRGLLRAIKSSKP